MKQENNQEPERNENKNPDKTTQWINKAEEFIDDAADKIHQSDAYRKAGKSMESVTKKVFRQAGKWWGKSQQKLK